MLVSRQVFNKLLVKLESKFGMDWEEFIGDARNIPHVFELDLDVDKSDFVGYSRRQKGV